ncbi:hypothetical protein MDAP_000084 [Mitosporidium daphniae]|uniref:Fibronectin type-III domain-containing protein n=1 Tax=Mitosporidium daphniae TaxID=1485682 RepID=A0A098VUW4_9MICR|nr:uncharacterized protein DI09_146p10 [Mitosporidium daphniae]KGG52669.1 hypothetical protein DI09_146p10 [Mitosporidium daphniae]|eukprot:XP_013239105.1 uncharacterized protein DI09_146p10 [Mitosporidium daphniae]
MISKNFFCVFALVCFFLTALAASTSVQPGVYAENITSSISNGTSSTFVIHSTGLSVVVDTTAPIYSNSSVSITWNFSAGFEAEATLVLISLKDPTFVYTQITVKDNGTATVKLEDFGDLNTSLRYFNISVSNKFGSSISNTFTVLSKDELKITLNTVKLSHGQKLGITWQPINTLGLANVSIIRLSNGTVTSIESNIADTGSLTADITSAPGAYQVIVNSSIGSGVSEIFQVRKSFEVTLNPNNISSADPKTTVSWNLYDEYQNMVNLCIYKEEFKLYTIKVKNNGSHSLDLTKMDLPLGLYGIAIESHMGNGISDLYIYSSSGLVVSSPNATSSIFNNTEAIRVEWAPFDIDGEVVEITLVNNNTGAEVVKIAENTGSYDVNISELNIPVGTYHVIVSSELGAGTSSPFILRYAQNLSIVSPNATTDVSKYGSLIFNWFPTNLAGGNVSIYIYQPSNEAIVYGPFSTVDDGNAELNLAKKLITKNLVVDDSLSVAGIDSVAASGVLNRKKSSFPK